MLKSGSKIYKTFNHHYDRFFAYCLKVKVHARIQDVYHMVKQLQKLMVYRELLEALYGKSTEKNIPWHSLEVISALAEEVCTGQRNLILIQTAKVHEKTREHYLQQAVFNAERELKQLRSAIKPAVLELKKPRRKKIKKIITSLPDKQINEVFGQLIYTHRLRMDKLLRAKSTTVTLQQILHELKTLKVLSGGFSKNGTTFKNPERLKGLLAEAGDWKSAMEFAASLRLKPDKSLSNAAAQRELLACKRLLDKQNKVYARDIFVSMHEWRQKYSKA